MSDATTTLGDLKAVVAAFVAERNWEQFHTPKNLAMALAIEAAELMEHFQWLTPEQSLALRASEQKRVEVEEEMADVLCYLLSMASRLEIDLASAVRRKMVKNEAKYPARTYHSRFGPEDPAFFGETSPQDPE